MMKLSSRFALISTLLAVSVRAEDYTSVCHQIASNISSASAVNFPGAGQYTTDLFHAFTSSSTNASCTVEPGSEQDISNIFKIIGQTRTPYAVKSGGHATNPGWSSTPGVQITMSRFNQNVYNSSTGVAVVGTGQTGELVYKALEPYNVTIAAGRVAGVGVGGFTLGGGYAWVTNQVGLSCDTVVAFEVVTPTGKILTATNQTNSDLFFGLKGGGNNFGVVTKIHYQTVHQPAVWGGLVIVNGTDNISSASKAIADFQDNNKDPFAAIGVTYAYDPAFGGPFLSLFFYYHGPSPPQGTFNEVLAVPQVSSTLSTTSLTSLVSSLNGPVSSPNGLWRSISIANYTVPVLSAIENQVKKYGPAAWNHSATAFTVAVEPLLTSIFNHQINGPAAYQHDPDAFVAPSVVGMSWNDASQDDWFFAALKDIDDSIRSFAESDAGGDQPLAPPKGILYSNYASFDVPSSRFFGRNIPQLQQTQKKYDPHNVTGLTKGWKF